MGIFADFVKAFSIAHENPDEFYWRASAISAHLTPIVMRILASGLPEIEELEGLNNAVAFLDLDVEEFLLAFLEQVEDVFIACANYAPFQPYWAEMEPILIGFLQRMQGEEDEGEEEEGEQMVIG